MNKFTLAAVAAMNLTCTVALSMNSGDLNLDALDGILTEKIITKANQLSNGTIFIVGVDEKDDMDPIKLMGAIAINAQDNVPSLKVTVNWPQIKELLPVREVIKEVIREQEVIKEVMLKPTLLKKLFDPVTLCTAVTAGVLCYWFAKHNNE